MGIEFAQSAHRHRVGRERARDVISHPIVTATISDHQGRDDRLAFSGDDTGRALEVLAVPLTDDGLLVIHVMDLRPTWRLLYEEGRRDREAD